MIIYTKDGIAFYSTPDQYWLVNNPEDIEDLFIRGCNLLPEMFLIIKPIESPYSVRFKISRIESDDSPTIHQKLEKLENLWSITKDDWILEISQTLTEPVCPQIRIYPEREDWNTDYALFADSIEEGIDKAVELVYTKVVLNKDACGNTPWTNQDPKTLLLEKRVKYVRECLNKTLKQYGLTMDDLK